MKNQRSKFHRLVTWAPPKPLQRPVASTLAPDLHENGKLRKHGRSIVEFMPSTKRATKS